MRFSKQFKRAFLSVIAALVFAAMVVADLKPVEAGTTVVTLSQSGGTSQKFSRDPSFSLDKDSSWITIKTSSPSDFTISASSNSTGKGRIGYVYVKRQGVTVNTYKIIQPGTTSLSVGPAKGSTSTYSKNSNQSVTTSYSWITLYKPNDYNVRMDYAANTTGSTRTGYVYVKEGSTIITTYKITQSATVSVTYNKNGGSGSNFSRTLTVGSAYGKVDNPTRTGYNFTGWYTAASGGSQVTETTKVTNTSNHTLYAHWSAKSYTVSFNGNGGSSVSAKTVYYDGTYGSLTNSSRTGYTFAGWFTAASGGTQVTSSTKVTITANQTLYAHWTPNNYTVSFNSQGGSSVSSKTVTFNSTYGTLSNPTKTGYTFAGWYTAASGGTKITSSSTVTTAGNHTLYAHWTANTYTITYDKNGGAGENFTRSITYGSNYGKVDNPTRTGYTFAGYYTAKSGGTQVTETTKMLTAGSHTLYAHWTAKTYTVSFNSQGGSSVASKTVTYGCFYETLASPTKEGYTFAGWYTAASGGNKVTASTTVTTASSHTLYAHWTGKTYTVSFDSQGGSSVSSKTVTYGSTYGTLTSPTKTGYTFAGWYTAASGGSQKTASSTVSTAGNHTLYAHWTANNFTITYDKNDGSGSTFTKSVAYGSTYGKVDTPSRTGYTFNGYYTAKSGGSQVTETTKMLTASNHTLYGRWTPKTFTVSFDSQGGSSVASKTVTYDGTYGTLTNPTKEGYTFDGWYTAASGGTKITASTKVTLTANQTLYAHYTQIVVTVTYDKNGGSGDNYTRKIAYGSTYGKVDNPTKTGYDFRGWYTSTAYETQVTETTLMKKTVNHTLYAKWTPKTFTITFDSQGGSSVSSKTVTYDGTYGTLTNPTKEGYTFDGWYTAASGGTKITASTKVTLTANQTLYAHYTQIVVTVTYDKNGGSGDNYVRNITYGSVYGKVDNPTRTGYEFHGWWTSKKYDTQVTESTLMKRTDNHTLYAKWTQNKYTVSFDSKGGSAATSKTVTYDNTYGTLPTTTKKGFTFDGWYTAASGGTKITASSKVATAGDHTLYAHWTANNYTVSFDSQGGSSVSAMTVAYGSAYGTLPTTTKKGYTFAGWYTAASGGTKITSSTIVTTTTNQKLYAHWTVNNYTVSFDSQGGSAVSSKTVTYGSTYGTLTSPSKDGYAFVGWYTAASGGTKITSSTTVTTAGNHTLCAHWAEIVKITVKYYDDDGNLVYTDPFFVGDQVIFRGKDDDRIEEFKKAGYEMDGWTSSKGNTNLVYEFDTEYLLDKSINLYPHWESAKTRITYCLGDGYIESQTDGCGCFVTQFDIYYQNCTDNLCAEVPICYTDGEEFVGWGFCDDAQGLILERMYTSDNSVLDVLNHVGFEHNGCFSLQAVYKKKGTWKISETGGIWYDKAGDMAINLKGEKGKEFIEYVYTFINDHRELREAAEDAEWNFWLTVVTTIIPTGIDDFIVNWAQNGFVNAYWDAGKELTDWSYQELLELSETHKTTMDIWSGWTSFYSCAMALIETGEYHTQHLEQIYQVYDRLEILYDVLEKNKMFDSSGKAQYSDYWILFFDGSVFIRTETDGNLMIIPPGKDPKDGRWMESKHFTSNAIEAILLQKSYFFSDWD